MAEARWYGLGDILSVTTGKLVSPRHVDALYDLLGFMTSDELYTHQLPRAQDECRPRLLEQFPELAQVDASSVNRETWREWLDEQIARFGSGRMVVPLDPEDHTRVHPLQESNIQGKRVFVISEEAPPA